MEQRVEQGAALALFHAVDCERELRIDEQYLAAGHRMDAHHRVKLRRILQLEVLQLLTLLQALTEQRPERLHIVDGGKAGDVLLHAVA